MPSRIESVIYASSNLLADHAASALNIMEMCNAFAKRRLKTLLCVPGNNLDKVGLYEYYGIEYPFDVKEIKIPKLFLDGTLPGRSLVFSVFLAAYLSKTHHDVIYTRDVWIFFIMTIIFNKHCIHESHQFRFSCQLQNSIYRRLINLGVSSGKGFVVCISQSLLEQWKQYGIDKNRMLVAHDAVNLRRFCRNTEKEAARKRLNLDLQAPLVIYTGSLKPGKGVEVLVNCANSLPGISFVIVGGLSEQIEEFRRSANQGNVIFAGQVSPSEVALYQAAADILALPNTRGSVIDDITSPMKLFEYIASQRPIIASDMPSLLEILRHKHNALISPAGDAGSLAKNINVLLTDPGLRDTLVKNASSDLASYTWDARVNCILDSADAFVGQ